MTQEDLLGIAEDFNEWLKEMADKYGMDEDDVQEIISHFIR